MIEAFEQAARITADALAAAKPMVRGGVRLLEIAERLERLICERGARPAFPVNICVGSIAAHYSPLPDDPRTLPDRGLVKIDVGAHVDGYPADAAITVDISGDYGWLIDEAETYLEALIANLRPGVAIKRLIKQTYEEAKPLRSRLIVNLCGHQLQRFKLHGGKSIPVVPPRFHREVIREGEVFAVEVFTTTTRGAGEAVAEALVTIYSHTGRIPGGQLGEISRQLLARFNMLPFSPRWLDPSEVGLLSQLHKKRVLTAYPVLREGRNEPVAQAEHTVVIERGGARVLTRF